MTTGGLSCTVKVVYAMPSLLLKTKRLFLPVTRSRRLLSMMSITAEEFKLRRENLMKLMAEENPGASDSSSVAMLFSKRQLYSAPGIPIVFRQESNFRYLSGFAEPDTARLVITPKESVLFTELDRSEKEVLWDGSAPDAEQIERESAVNRVLPLSELEPYLANNLNSDTVLAVDEGQVHEETFYDEDVKAVCAQHFSRVARKIPLFPLLDKLRWVKSPAELDLLRRACDIGSQMHTAAMRHASAFSNESHFVGLLEFECRRRGAQFMSYPPVVACGNNANTIHYIASNQHLRRGEVVLIDAGCDVEGYCSDITRCIPMSGAFERPQKFAYNALDTIQSALLHYVENVRPLKLNELYEHMIETMVDVLSSFIFFTDETSLSRDDKRAICHELCPHHVSHYLGLDVHDCPTVPRNIEMPPGVVFTVEPGIYIRPDNVHIREEFRGLGLRIEDDVLLTDTGFELLTVAVIRSAADIERRMKC